MSDIAISVEQLSKSFKIDHESIGRRAYRTLHDDLIGLPKRLLSRLSRNGRSTSEIFWALKNISFEVKQGEVLAVGDAEFQKKCLGKMDDVVTKEGRTIMFVSHNIDAICHLCSRCILLRHGEIDLSGNTAEVVAAYLGAGQQQPPVVYFKAAGSEASFQVAGLHGPEGESSTSFSANAPVLMKCSFTLQRSIPGLQVSFSVFNFKGEEVFYSTNSMAEPAISVESDGTDHR